MSLRTLLMLGIGLSACVPFGAKADASVDSIARCAATLAERDEFAGTVAIARNGELLYSQAFGPAGRGDSTLSAATPHNVGSMGKMFTAVAIGQLVDSGRLGFDDPVGRYLPELPADIGRVTIAQLLSHTSGMGDFFRPPNRATIAAARTATDLVPIAILDGLRFEPGTSRAYSNSGFVVLGAVIERISGQSYADYVRDHVLRPAGMDRTSLELPAGAATPMTRMTSSGEGAAQDRRPAPLVGGGRASPAGGAYSTAEDLLRFAAALLANRLTRPATTAALLRAAGTAAPASPRTGQGGGYGRGFNLWEVNGVTFAGHGGGTRGVNGELSFNPADGTAVAALSHYDPPSASQVVAFARHVLATLDQPVDPALCGTLASAPPGQAPRQRPADAPSGVRPPTRP